MNVLIDTSIWSLSLRSKSPDAGVSAKVRQLILEGRAKIIGPIRQELLSGIGNPSQFALLKNRLQAFDDIILQSEHYEHAAEICNQCRSKGIAGSHTDFLMCAVSKMENLAIFSSDKDFNLYSRIIGLSLYKAKDV